MANYEVMMEVTKKKLPEDSGRNAETGKIEYKYNEDVFLDAIKKHVDSTYSAHYSGGIQTAEFIMSNADSLDYLKGNVFKYIQRYGKKEGANPTDLYKAAHYILMMLHYTQQGK